MTWHFKRLVSWWSWYRAIARLRPSGYARAMRCLVTAGPTYEPLDSVRRLTNFSTGRLGSELANYLTRKGHDVTLLIGEQATCRVEQAVARVLDFGTTASLREQLCSEAGTVVDAVFHAAAVSDFAFSKIWRQSDKGELVELRAGKLGTREGTLLAELVPTPKIISQLRAWFPHALLVGWKYEVEGDRATVLRLAKGQIIECRTNACVANGPAYGAGFGLVTENGALTELADRVRLYQALDGLLSSRDRLERPAAGPP